MEHPRYHVHFTPTSASWLNQIERWFAEITRKRIRRGTFGSVRDLERAIREYIRETNKNPKPFEWVASANTIIRKVRKYKRTSETGHEARFTPGPSRTPTYWPSAGWRASLLPARSRRPEIHAAVTVCLMGLALEFLQHVFYRNAMEWWDVRDDALRSSARWPSITCSRKRCGVDPWRGGYREQSQLREFARPSAGRVQFPTTSTRSSRWGRRASRLAFARFARRSLRCSQ